MRILKESILSRSSHSGEGFKAQRREMIEKWLKEYDIQNYTINDDFIVDVNGDVDLKYKELTEFPEYIQFGVVTGFFSCYKNQLTSLRGCPKEIGKFFDCSYNNLTSLRGAPKKVEDLFDCSNNQLTTLEGAPKEVGGDFDCRWNKLTSLEEAPKEIGGNFECSNNRLISLKGAPKDVGRDFYCDSNNLTSLKGAPRKVGGDFDCYKNDVQFTRKDVEKICNVKGVTHTSNTY